MPKRNPLRLSRSRWDNFIKCPKCFYLKEKHNINPPGQPGHPINSRVDALLKEEFDILRSEGKKHPIFKEYNLNFIPYNKLDPEVLKNYRTNSKGVEAKSQKTKYTLFGSLDDLWFNLDTDEIVVLDYKATSNKNLEDYTTSTKHYHKSYLRQLDFYAYLLKLNDFKVHKIGYWLICNAADENQKTFNNIKGRPYAPKGEEWEKAIEFWKSLPSDDNAKYDKEININAEDITPQITWGTSPQDVVPINGRVPNPSSVEDINRKKSIERSLEYMGLEPDQEINEIKIDKVFIGSCTNGRIEDLREVARVVKGKKVSVDSMIVPGSGLVKEQAESEGLDKIFIEAGFDWREPGCSMCLAMNPDQLKPRERCASTSNRNFEGRQGREGRTHLVSPVVAAASAIKGSFAQETDL